MRVVKVLDAHCPKFYAEVSPWKCVAVVADQSYVPKGERYITYDNGSWIVYAKSRVHMSVPRYAGRYNNVLSAVHKARLV